MSGIATAGIAIGAGLAVAGTAIGAGIAEKEIGAAAIGSFTEKPNLFGKGLPLPVIPETPAIWAGGSDYDSWHGGLIYRGV